LSAIAVLAIIAVVFLSHHPKVVSTAVVPENTPLPAPAEWPSTKVSDKKITETGSYYSINATYPVTKNDVITGYFSSFVQDSITEFKSDTSWAAGSGANSEAAAEDGLLSLNVTYTEQKNANADNYIFSVDENSGGAHDLVSTKTFSFSATGQLITISSLFTNGDDGLKTIAPYVAAQLATAADADSSMIAQGTAPTDDNYQNFTVAPDGVTFIFDPYEVGPYSDGQQTVKVPVSAFASIASTDLFSSAQ